MVLDSHTLLRITRLYILNAVDTMANVLIERIRRVYDHGCGVVSLYRPNLFCLYFSMAYFLFTYVPKLFLDFYENVAPCYCRYNR